jgi:ABC-type nitrate/sulfonate/bicarbonate transport system ATPase subunit
LIAPNAPGTVQPIRTDPEAKVAPPALLSLVDVGFRYPDGTQVLDGIDLRVGGGQITGIVGPSGCGKSTLLSLVAGFARPDRGSIDADQSLMASQTKRPSCLPKTMVFQDDTVLPWKTVAGNVRFGMAKIALTKGERNDRVKELLELARLSEYAMRYPYQLSGGQRRRVAFLTAVAPMPKLLLLDEPFAALDEPTRLGVHRDIRRIITRLHMTVVLVSHDLAEVISLSDKLHLLTRAPSRVARTYVTPFAEDRDVFTLRESSDYLELYRRVWHDLRNEIEQATDSDGHEQ